MDVSNRNVYYNCIYQAVVVNADTSQDPNSLNRIQIYVPALHYNFEGVYKQYIQDNNKSNSIYKSYFPWATTAVDELTNGDIVFCNFLNNDPNSFIIIGKDIAANKTITSNGQGGGGDYNGSLDLLDLTMPIIISNEVGINPSQWPDSISDSQYTNINPYDNGGWSIGLIQWHHCRAFDVLYYIASKDTSWKSKFTDKSIDLYIDLEKSLASNSTTPNRNKYQSSYHPTSGTAANTSIKNLLGSDIGKTAQREYASQDTNDLIIHLQNDYKINNPAVIIFLTDILNQYGKYKTTAKEKAKEICSSKEDMMTQLSKFRMWWDSATGGAGTCTNGSKRGAYSSRRDKTYSYIVQLESQGKLYNGGTVDLGILSRSKYIPEIGEYYWPLRKTTYITAYWGDSTVPYNYAFNNYNSDSKKMGYGSLTGWHAGVDFGCPEGEALYAVGSGKVVSVTVDGQRHTSLNPWISTDKSGPSEGNCVIIQMNKNKEHYFAYMHLIKPSFLKVGDTVKAGDLIGYSGTTGHSTGPHLHLGLHIGAPWGKNGKARDSRVDPLPYLGKKANA